MSSPQNDVNASHNEVTNISQLGLWLLVGDKEYFVPFKDYPEFTEATISQIYHLQRSGPGHFHWPDLDVDIELQALENPDKYPLKYR